MGGGFTGLELNHCWILKWEIMNGCLPLFLVRSVLMNKAELSQSMKEFDNTTMMTRNRWRRWRRRHKRRHKRRIAKLLVKVVKYVKNRFFTCDVASFSLPGSLRNIFLFSIIIVIIVIIIKVVAFQFDFAVFRLNAWAKRSSMHRANCG